MQDGPLGRDRPERKGTATEEGNSRRTGIPDATKPASRSGPSRVSEGLHLDLRQGLAVGFARHLDLAITFDQLA